MRCGYRKPDGSQCNGAAKKGSTRCRHHQMPEGGEVHGQAVIEKDPGSYPGFYDNYTAEEVRNYVANRTNGRVMLPFSTRDMMIDQAIEALS